MSAREDIWLSPNSIFIFAKTRSQDAELGEMAKATRAASAHTGNALPFTHHHLSSASVKGKPKIPVFLMVSARPEGVAGS